MTTLKFDYPVFDGIMFLPYNRYRKDVRKAVEEIRNFPSRPSDILICASMKSGSHWLFEIISMLTSGKLEFSKDCVTDSHIDLEDSESFEKKPEPRILHTHLPYTYIPDKHKDNGYKIVYIVRNPKDRHVSLFHFALGYEPYPLDLSWSDYIENITMDPENEIFGGWFKYTKEWERQIELKHANIHLVYYEELKKNFQETVKKLAAFLKLSEKDDSFYDDLERTCNFQNMKQNKPDDTVSFDSLGRSLLYRKGDVGDWKNHFTVAQNEKFDELYKKEMEGSRLKFIYE